MRATSPKRPRRQARAAQERALLNALSAGLSDQELQRVLAGALVTLRDRDMDRLAARLGPETGRILKKLMKTRGAKPKGPKPVASASKVQQEWEKAWRQWWECLDETGHEGGRYVVQDHHWEPSYVDTPSLATDLDGIAKEIRKLIPAVMDKDVDPDFSMTEAFTETAEMVGAGLPEWLQPPDGDAIELGPEATACLLEWEERAARREGLDAYAVVERIRGLEHTADLGLDGTMVAAFVDRLGDESQRLVLEGIEAHKDSGEWSDVLSWSYSPWFTIYQDLCRRWDRDRYFRTCRECLSEDWKLAVPLVTDLCKSKQYADAASTAEGAVHVLLHRREGERFDPGAALVVAGTSEWSEDKNLTVALLKGWLQAAEALDRTELAWSLRIQLVTYEKRQDWDAVLDGFKRIPPGWAAMRNACSRRGRPGWPESASRTPTAATCKMQLPRPGSKVSSRRSSGAGARPRRCSRLSTIGLMVCIENHRACPRSWTSWWF